MLHVFCTGTLVLARNNFVPFLVETSLVDDTGLVEAGQQGSVTERTRVGTRCVGEDTRFGTTFRGSHIGSVVSGKNKVRLGSVVFRSVLVRRFHHCFHPDPPDLAPA